MALLWISITYLFFTIHNAGAAYDGPAPDSCEADDMFRCDDTHCVPLNKRCNGISECKNGLDESVQECGCGPNEFQCNRTSCVDMVQRCDLTEDCFGGEDETGCDTFTCLPTHTKCENDFCIPRDLWCNFKDDCGDNSDEAVCTHRDCFSSEWRCNNSQCITAAYICDGSQDCADGSDEVDCDLHVKCDNGLYVSSSHRCDGWVDCFDSMNDELNCGPCGQGYFRCRNSRCIPQANHCDGYCDCGFSCEDEHECPYTPCLSSGTFACLRGIRCIQAKYVCNGRNECWDNPFGHDEVNCSNDTCPDDHYACPGGKCLPQEVQCNGIPDCADAVDELDCGSCEPTGEQFRCGSGECVHNSQRCDNLYDCVDYSDEKDCAGHVCPAGRRSCASGHCVEGHLWCDFHRDCPDGSDEGHCDRPTTCGQDEFQCLNGQCIPQGEVCLRELHHTGNRVIGCADSSHLLNCKEFQCGDGLFKCRKSYCINETGVCDHLPDCMVTQTDEETCEYPCPFPDDLCMCLDINLNCENKSLLEVPDTSYEKGLSKFHLAGNLVGLQLTVDTFYGLDHLLHLDLSNNSIHSVEESYFKSLWRLVTLNLRDNFIREIRNGSFSGLYNLNTLYLEGNRIEVLYPYAFSGLPALKALDLSGQSLVSIPQNAFSGLRHVRKLNLSLNALRYISDGAFSGLPNLLILDITMNYLSVVEDNVFNGLQRLNSLFADEFRFCCLAAGVSTCLPEPDEFSSCEDLMSNYMLRISIWVLGTLALFGNAAVIVWRIRDARDSRVHSFLITNMALGDLCMGVYLLLIASIDLYYRGVYIVHDKTWRESATCQFAGFLSTFSSELSVFTLTVITTDRFLSIIFPFRLKRLDMNDAKIVMACTWIVVVLLAVTPFLPFEYFSNFYGRSGVCLALHITSDKPSGWEYAVFVFLVLNLFSFFLISISYMWMFLVARETRMAARGPEIRNDHAMARRMLLIVLTDFFCWIPIILLGFASLGGATIPPQVFAWIAVFVLPFNAAVNPVLYTLSTASFLGHARRKAFKFRISFMSSLAGDTKTSVCLDDDRFSQSGERTRHTTTSSYRKKYQQMELAKQAFQRDGHQNKRDDINMQAIRNGAHRFSEVSLSQDTLRGEVVYVYDADNMKTELDL